jgi:hypothetical protein
VATKASTGRRPDPDEVVAGMLLSSMEEVLRSAAQPESNSLQLPAETPGGLSLA